MALALDRLADRGSSPSRRSRGLAAHAPKGRVLVATASGTGQRHLRQGLIDAGFAAVLIAPETGRSGSAVELAADVVVADVSDCPAELVRSLRRGGETAVVLVAEQPVPSIVRAAAWRAGASHILEQPVADEVVACVENLTRDRRRRDTIRVDDLTIDRSATLVQRGGAEIPVTATEFRLLLTFALHVDHILSKRQLLDHVWGDDGYVANVVEAGVCSLRRKLEAAGPRLIHTIRGMGYVMCSSLHRRTR